MKRIILEQVKELSTNILIISLFLLIIQILSIYVISTNSAISTGIEMWVYAADIIDFFYPLLITLPFTWVIFFRKKNNYYDYVSTRFKLSKYIISQCLAIALVAFLITFLVNLLGIFASIFIINPQHLFTGADAYSYSLPPLPLNIEIRNQIIFGIFASLWKGAVAAIITIGANIIAFTTKNIFISSFFVFVYFLLENMLTGALNLNEYSIVTSLSLGRLDTSYYTTFNMFVGPCIFLIVSSSIFLYTTKRERYLV